MKRLMIAVLALAISTLSFSQGSIVGKVIDAESGEAIISATVRLDNSTKGALTDLSGNFEIKNVTAGEHTVKVSYVSFDDITEKVMVKDGAAADIGTLKMESSSIGLKEIQVVASVAVDRKTPVAVSTISAKQIEERLGNQEFPELLKSTPSIYTTKQGGGFGDARINIRGFSQENFALLINGISVSGMEDNRVYWSNWAGLGDVTRTMQVQRGLGASRLAITSVGGTINIITKTTDQRKGGSVWSSIGNDGYKKTGMTLSTGRTDNGWAFTFTGSRTTGDGYIEGAYIDAWSYFGSVAKELGKDQQLIFTVFGAPQRHGQRDFQHNIGDQRDVYGIRWNDDYGKFQGEDFLIRENFYHKPQANLNHIWQMNEGTTLVTAVYGSVGRGGGTGDLGGFVREDGAYRGREFRQPRDVYGHHQYDQWYLYNSGQANSLYDTSMVALNYETAEGETGTAQIAANGQNGLIKRASMNQHNWYGVLSTLTTELSETLTLSGGLDVRFYTGSHYRKTVNLMGAEYWFDDDNINNQFDWVDLDGDGIQEEGEWGNLVQPTNDAERLWGNVDRDERIDYNNDENINWYGLFGQLEYSKDQLSAFVSGAFNNTQMRRIDFFSEPDSDNTTDWLSFTGGNLKLGANYNLNENHNVFLNGGYISRAPYFDALFPTFDNDAANEDAVNEKITSVELGYGYRGRNFSMNLNGYWTQWEDKTDVSTYEDPVTEDILFLNLLGVNALHSGLELDFTFLPVRNVTVTGFASLNNWEWTNNPSGVISDENNEVIGEQEYFIDGLKVGDAAQTTFGLNASVNLTRDLSVDAQCFYFDNLYASYSPDDRDDVEEAGIQVLQLPDYGLVDAGLTWTFQFAGLDAKARVNVNNVFDTQYIAEATDRIRTDESYDELLDNTR
ncbi:MAG: TonB-dependent receptor, partial [Flavobacteriales bacterium]|nr:TonB-dependent receptor [Flavobacteriales bacterium]